MNTEGAADMNFVVVSTKADICANEINKYLGFRLSKEEEWQIAAIITESFPASRLEAEVPIPSPTEALTASGVSASPEAACTCTSRDNDWTRPHESGCPPSSPSPLVAVEEWTEALCDQFCDEVQIGYSCKQEYLDKREELKKRLRVIVNASLASLTSRLEEALAWQRDVQEREAACCTEDVGFDELIGRLRAPLAVAEARLKWLHVHARWTDKERRMSITFPMETVKFVTLNETIDAAIKSDSGITDAP